MGAGALFLSPFWLPIVFGLYAVTSGALRYDCSLSSSRASVLGSPFSLSSCASCGTASGTPFRSAVFVKNP